MCLWDAESLRELDLRDSDVGRAVQGVIPKHTPYFYEAKLAYTVPMLDGGAGPDRWDDVAVAHLKRERTGDALRVIDEKDRRFPGLYTTYANRGTFLARSGRLDDGIADLERALAIDPHAHFGREQVQIDLYRYLRRAAADASLVAREDFLGTPLDEPPRDKIPDDTTLAIVGMMTFGAGDRSPHLWLALGLALAREHAGEALGIAALRRAEVLGHPHARAAARRVDADYYDEATGELDKAFAEGQAEVAEQAAAEDARLLAGEREAVFGY